MTTATTANGSGSAADVLANLQTISALSGVGDLTVTGNNGGPFSIVFAGTLAAADQPQILSSTATTATTATAINGSATLPISVTGSAPTYTIAFRPDLFRQSPTRCKSPAARPRQPRRPPLRVELQQPLRSRQTCAPFPI